MKTTKGNIVSGLKLPEEKEQKQKLIVLIPAYRSKYSRERLHRLVMELSEKKNEKNQ